MRVGTFGYCTSRGLGHLVRDFHRHGIITDPFLIMHHRVPNNPDWYSENTPRTSLNDMDTAAMEQFALNMDAMLFFETPFHWDIIPFCEKHGIRTYLVTMYECTPIEHPRPHKYICPSLLDMEYFQRDSVQLNLPVEVEWRPRGVVQHYVHNGGYLGLRGREGTTLLIDALPYIKSPIQLTIRVQENVSEGCQLKMAADPRVTYIAGTVPYHELYSTGEAVVAPQKFNGCSLPLQEAFASGMLMITTDRFPMNSWLPEKPLIPVSGYLSSRVSGRCLSFQEAIVDPVEIAHRIDEWYGKDASEFSYLGQLWAEANSWEVLKPKYLEVLSN